MNPHINYGQSPSPSSGPYYGSSYIGSNYSPYTSPDYLSSASSSLYNGSIHSSVGANGESSSSYEAFQGLPPPNWHPYSSSSKINEESEKNISSPYNSHSPYNSSDSIYSNGLFPLPPSVSDYYYKKSSPSRSEEESSNKEHLDSIPSSSSKSSPPCLDEKDSCESIIQAHHLHLLDSLHPSLSYGENSEEGSDIVKTPLSSSSANNNNNNVNLHVNNNVNINVNNNNNLEFNDSVDEKVYVNDWSSSHPIPQNEETSGAPVPYNSSPSPMNYTSPQWSSYYAMYHGAPQMSGNTPSRNGGFIDGPHWWSSNYGDGWDGGGLPSSRRGVGRPRLAKIISSDPISSNSFPYSSSSPPDEDSSRKRGPGRPRIGLLGDSTLESSSHLMDETLGSAVSGGKAKSANKKRYVCEICQKRFSTAWYVRVHRKSHNGERPYICHNCGKGFMLPNVLQVHLRKCEKSQNPEVSSGPSSTPESPGPYFNQRFGYALHSSPYSETTYGTGSSLETESTVGSASAASAANHYGIPSVGLPVNGASNHFLGSERPPDKGGGSSGGSGTEPSIPNSLTDMTDFEDMILSSSSSLEDSSKNSSRPYTCEICDKRFSQRCNLITHRRLHTGEKPYSCSFCDKRFTQKGNLDAHLKTHSKEKYRNLISSGRHREDSYRLSGQINGEDEEYEEYENDEEQEEQEDDIEVIKRLLHTSKRLEDDSSKNIVLQQQQQQQQSTQKLEDDSLLISS